MHESVVPTFEEVDQKGESMAESEARKVFSKIDGELNTAQHQWNTYAKGLGLAYAYAYKNHKDTLDHMDRKRTLELELTYALFSGFIVGAAGGFVGQLMAPWVEMAGKRGGNEYIRAVVRGALQEEAERAIMLPQKWVEMNTVPAAGPFKPSVDDPYTSETRMTYEIGICFSNVRDYVRQFKTWADEKKLSASAGETMFRLFRSQPLISDQPTTGDMPDIPQRQREAEIGMWIAWANALDLKWWYFYADRGTDGKPDIDMWGHIRSALSQYDPVLSQLNKLLVGNIVTIYSDPYYSYPYRSGSMKKKAVLNVPILRVLGEVLGGGFHSKVAEIVRNPKKALPEMASLPPIYKQE